MQNRESHATCDGICCGMESLGRYPLTVILSFLTETDGTCLLITKKRYAYNLLPLFQIKNKDPFHSLVVQGDCTTQPPHTAWQQPQRRPRERQRHRFVVAPVQDASTLLSRLNTRKLFKRKNRPLRGYTTEQLATFEWKSRIGGTTTTTTTGGSCMATWAKTPETLLLRFLTPRQDEEWRRCGGTVLVSYPRSGNTLMRTLLERTTGIVTGSDTRPDRNLSRALAEQHNLVGEGITQSSQVLFVKSHWPERMGNQLHEARRAVVLVRNPYDAIDSYWNLNATVSHTKTVTDEVYERFADKFHRLVQNEIRIWLYFHEYWLEQQSSIPILFIRFEDLIRDPAYALKRVLQFTFNNSEQLSPFWEEQVRFVTQGSANSTANLGSYRPRVASSSLSIGKSLRKRRYSPEILDYIHRAARDLTKTNFLTLFGYSIQEQGFPDKIPSVECSPEYVSPGNHLGGRPLLINESEKKLIRPNQCEFGRALQLWRWSVTDHDRNPLPTVCATNTPSSASSDSIGANT